MKKTFICLLLLFSVSEMMAQTSGVNIGSMYNGYGYQTYSSTSAASYYTLVGTGTGDSNYDHDYSAYFGWQAGYDGSGTKYNTAIGYISQYGNASSTGDYNTSVGSYSLYYFTSGSYNSTLGVGGLYNLTSGGYNTTMGRNAGYYFTTGSYNTFLGANTSASSSAAQNQTVVGYGVTSIGDNTVTLGNSNVTAVYMAQDSGATVYAAGLNLGSTAVTSTAAELNILDGVTATSSEINIIDGVTATTTEINYVDGVTSNVQTQLDSKQATIIGAATTITSTNLAVSRALTSNGSGKVEVSAVTSTELGYLDGVTSAVQTQLDAKQATITGAATTIASSDLTASRALTSNGSGKVEVSAVTSTELGYLDGVTSAVQTQLDSKLSSSGNITVGGNVIIPDAGTIGSTSDTDAMTIAANGNTTFSQDITVSGDVTISSDARLKSNIVSLGSTLSKLLLIDGKSYIMNKSGEEKIGILAQEVQEVFPELVSKDDNEMLSVNYQGLVPVLINAIKEQENKISRLEKLVEQLISKN